jgi:hypothetical protein
MPSHGVSLGMPEAFVHDTSRMNREVHVRLCRLARGSSLGGHLAFFDRAKTLAVGIMNRKAVIYSVPLGMAHRSAATAWSWPSPITNSLPATPRHKESSRPACRPVGGQILPLARFASNAFGIRASAAAALVGSRTSSGLP